jgi:hypothetical protein
MRLKRELPSDARQRWCFDGRRAIQGLDCYVWKRYLDQPDPLTGYHTMSWAYPVAIFWPE